MDTVAVLAEADTRAYPWFWLALVGGGVLLLVGVPWLRVALRSKVNSDADKSGGVALMAVLLGLVTLVFGTFPWTSMDYHHYVRVSGTVVTVSPRMIADGNATTQVYPVEIAGQGVYRCDDSRCAVLKPGATVALWCKKKWQWVGTPGWICSYGSSEAAPAVNTRAGQRFR